MTVKVQLYRTSEIVVSRWLGAWSMALMLWLPCFVISQQMAEQVNYGAVT